MNKINELLAQAEIANQRSQDGPAIKLIIEALNELVASMMVPKKADEITDAAFFSTKAAKAKISGDVVGATKNSRVAKILTEATKTKRTPKKK
jgi:hypothetical protein